MGLGVPAGNEKHTRRGFYFGKNPMREYNEYMARVAECERRAKDARTDSEKQGWLVMADTWCETAKLQEMMTRQAEFIRKVPMPSASGAWRGKRVVIGESFRLSRQTDGLPLAGPETVEKTKAKLARRSGKPEYRPPVHP
jgi:hypothetical protein